MPSINNGHFICGQPFESSNRRSPKPAPSRSVAVNCAGHHVYGIGYFPLVPLQLEKFKCLGTCTPTMQSVLVDLAVWSIELYRVTRLPLQRISKILNLVHCTSGLTAGRTSIPLRSSETLLYKRSSIFAQRCFFLEFLVLISVMRGIFAKLDEFAQGGCSDSSLATIAGQANIQSLSERAKSEGVGRGECSK
jgi:hypothetical protein